MRNSALTKRIAGDGAKAWQIHDRALEMREQGVDVLLLSIGDPDFDTPQPIVQAAIDSLQAGDTHYPDVCGAIISAVDRRWTQTMSSCFRGRNARCTRSRNACSIRAIR